MNTVETLELQATGGTSVVYGCVCVCVLFAEHKSRWHVDFENPKLGMFS